MSYRAPASCRPAESGNVMIYIFLGIALFAALSFAVANIMRSGTADPKRETMALYASDVIQYGDGLKRAVQAMNIRGLPDHMISFETHQIANYQHPAPVPPATTCQSDSCRVFQPSGGGMTYMPPPDSWLDSTGVAQALYGEWFFPAGVCVQNAGTGDTGCESDGEDNEELVAILPWVRKELCVAINNQLGIPNTGGNPPVAGGNAWVNNTIKFIGTFSEGAIIARNGQTAGCLRGNGLPPNNAYFYYKVLLAR